MNETRLAPNKPTLLILISVFEAVTGNWVPTKACLQNEQNTNGFSGFDKGWRKGRTLGEKQLE